MTLKDYKNNMHSETYKQLRDGGITYLEKATAKVFDMLMAVPKFGRVKAARLLNQCRISQSKTVGGLSDRQRHELLTLFNNR